MGTKFGGHTGNSEAVFRLGGVMFMATEQTKGRPQQLTISKRGGPARRSKVRINFRGSPSGEPS